MKKTVYAILVLAAPMMAQCPNSLLPPNVPCINQLPIREFGQPTLVNPNPNSAAPNLVVGQELFSPTAIAFDTSVSPPRVYVVDTGNNRILGWSNANNVIQGNMADLVLGQPAAGSAFDFTSTLQWGPGTTDSIGLNTPTGIAVDAAGNVYVADAGNNRILRFATPFQQQPGNLVVDLVIGQKGVASTSSGANNLQNQGQQTPSATTLFFSQYGQVYVAGLTIDTAGNLWATDPGNNRVLMYPAANLTANAQLPKATLALGQTNLTSNQLTNQSQTNVNILANPTSVAVDAQGNVYVTDAYARALYFPAPVSLGESAKTVLGIPAAPSQNQTVNYPTQSTLGGVNSNNQLIPAQGVFVLNNGGMVSVFVCDSPQNRVVRYDSMVVPNNANSPLESGVVGQNGYGQGSANQGQAIPSNQSFSNPVAGAIRPDNNEMWIVDQSNNRVVAFTSQGGGVYSTASRVLGQADFVHNGANLLEGRELWLTGGGGMALDSTGCSAAPNVVCSSPPHLYIADTQNNRVLGFKDARLVGVDAQHQLTQKADIVIGQIDPVSGNPSLLYSLINSPNNAAGQPTATGLYHPVGLAVDAAGNLWVADSGNGRVVRFPAPFAQPAGSVPTANMVLGQASFTSLNPSVSQFNMIAPFGLTIFPDTGGLAVSDLQANRILIFSRNGGDFTMGQAATYVIGQTGFTEATSGSGITQLNSPRHIGVDSSDRLYVCDYGNNRLLVYSKPAGNSPSAVQNTPVTQPVGITVSLATGLSWITSGNTVFQLPEFETLQSSQAATQSLTPLVLSDGAAAGPLALALDPFDDVIVADATNRVTFYFDQLFYRNTANYTTGLGPNTTAGATPTMLAELHLLGNNFNFTPSYSGGAANMNPPWPTTYTNGATNLQVTVNGIPAPIFRVDSSSINDGSVLIEIPNQAPTSGQATFVISNPSTGQIYAVANLSMQTASPGIYTANSGGTDAVAANNYDSKGNPLAGAAFINSPTNPVSAGGIIGLWLTGAGNVPGLPADGVPPGAAVYTPISPTVYIGAQVATVVASAMSPQFPGLWQVNVIVPASTPPSSVGPVSVVVKMNDETSNIIGTGTDISPGADQSVPASTGTITTIYVK